MDVRRDVAGIGLERLLPKDQCDRLHLTMNPEIPENVLDMGANRRGAEAETHPDFFCHHSLCQQHEDLRLALRERELFHQDGNRLRSGYSVKPRVPVPGGRSFFHLRVVDGSKDMHDRRFSPDRRIEFEERGDAEPPLPAGAGRDFQIEMSDRFISSCDLHHGAVFETKAVTPDIVPDEQIEAPLFPHLLRRQFQQLSGHRVCKNYAPLRVQDQQTVRAFVSDACLLGYPVGDARSRSLCPAPSTIDRSGPCSAARGTPRAGKRTGRIIRSMERG